ncbi:MAG: lipid-A-disaccharide synthase [Planctomycetota bacterium]|nr:lipid-A-disaccharide synthase [Planctomycetota bacterium]
MMSSDRGSSGKKGPRVFISAGEPSGDRIGAAFIRAFRSICPDSTFIGIGGREMQKEGQEVVSDLTKHAAMWLLKSLLLIPRMARLLRKCRRLLDLEKPDAVIVIDYPGFHFYLMREAKRRKIPSIYYVTPQIWAYNPYRAIKLRKMVDQALVVLPFEEAFLEARGIPTKYVGHPLMDDLRAEWGEELPSADENPPAVLGVLPGSREQEVVASLPHIARAAVRIRKRDPDVRIMASASRPELKSRIEAALRPTGIPIEILDGQTGRILRSSRLALVTSGTTTLEGVFHTTPMLVLYRIPAISYWASRPWQLIPHISLPNLLAGREVVPEFVLWRDKDTRFVDTAASCFSDPQERERIRAGLREVRSGLLARRDASMAAAQAVCEIVDQREFARNG